MSFFFSLERAFSPLLPIKECNEEQKYNNNGTTVTTKKISIIYGFLSTDMSP